MKKHLRYLILSLACLAGIIMIVYPALSNWLWETRQDGVVGSYVAAVEAVEDNSDKLAALEAAREYNRQLCNQGDNIELQYHVASELISADEVIQRLDITGSGILAYLEIPVIDVYLPVYYGTNDEDLKTGIGFLEYTSLPVGGEGTHTILAGHSGISNTRLFSDLPEMIEGDVFFIYVMGETLAYQVDQIVTVLPEDISQIGIEAEEDYCTLLTCTPFGINTHRLLVRGTRIDYVEAIEAEEEQAELTNRPIQTENTWGTEYMAAIRLGILLLIAVLVLLAILVFLRRLVERKKGAKA